MTDERLEISPLPSKFCKWSLIIVGLVFTVILFVVLFEVIILSKDVDESRRLLKELSSDLLKIKQENEKLRKQLGDPKETLEGISRELISAQGSHVRKARHQESREHHGCRKERKCFHKFIGEQLFNCTYVRQCIPPQDQGKSENLSWRIYDKKVTTKNIKLTRNGSIHIRQGGVYYIYCNLRVGMKYIEAVSVNVNDTIIFSTLSRSRESEPAVRDYHDVNLNGLAFLSEGDILYVQVNKTRPSTDSTEKNRGTFSFPYARNEEYLRPNDNFGLFMVSKNDVS